MAAPTSAADTAAPTEAAAASVPSGAAAADGGAPPTTVAPTTASAGAGGGVPAAVAAAGASTDAAVAAGDDLSKALEALKANVEGDGGSADGVADAARQLRRLVFNAYLHKLEAQRRGAIPVLVSALEHPTVCDVAVRSEVLQALRTLAFQCDPIGSAAPTNGIMDAGLQQLQWAHSNATASVAEEALKLLCALFAKNDANAAEASKRGVSEHVSLAMAAFPDSTVMKQQGAFALLALA